jgi:RND family efflux transporter MFP subunit
MRYLNVLLLTGAAVGLWSCAAPSGDKAAKDQDIIPVRLMPLNQSAPGTVIAASGKFTTDDEVYLSFKTGGVINKILVREGDAIKPGQLLATLHLTEINAQVGQVQAGYDKAVRDFQRVGNLYKDSVASLEQFQNAKTALELAKQQLSAAQFNRNYSEIRATQSGYVLHKLASEGQVVAPGTPVLQTNGAHNSSWLLRVGVSDRDWALIHTHDKATITSEAVPGVVLTGFVYRRSEGVDPATGSFGIDIKLDKHETAKIASGMYGNATITTAAAPASAAANWSVPYDALLDGDGSTGYVFITNDNQVAEKVKVTIAGMEKDRIWISDGLQNARSLIISGSAYLGDKSKIKVLP